MTTSDICLILEGTYPYVPGGVSSWVHQLISKCPHLTFSIITLMPNQEDCKTFKYQFPENVVEFVPFTLFESPISKKRATFWPNKKKAIQTIESCYDDMKHNRFDTLSLFFDTIINDKTRCISPYHLIYSHDIWELLISFYYQWGKSRSFIDFVWACKFSHQPIFRLFDAPIPNAKAYHTISTGYAGLLATIAHFKTKKPYFITEHGIYTNERRIEIEQAQWLKHAKAKKARHLLETMTPIKRLWIHYFDVLSRITYEFAEKIVTLHEKNQILQLVGGANPTKTAIIPNGIAIDPTLKLNKHTRTKTTHIGFIGRIVSIKDVKTLIRAIKIASDKYPQIKVSMLGPTEEEKEYFNECKDLVSLLKLNKVISFKGKVNLSDYLPSLDIVVLTSISEGQPLVILEAGVYGIPCISTDVGSCNELLNGRTVEDIAIGPSGIITDTYSPSQTADAMISLIESPQTRTTMGKAAKKRIDMFYNETQFVESYHKLYQDIIKE